MGPWRRSSAGIDHRPSRWFGIRCFCPFLPSCFPYGYFGLCENPNEFAKIKVNQTSFFMGVARRTRRLRRGNCGSVPRCLCGQPSLKNRVQRHAGHAGGRHRIIFRSGRTTISTPAGFRSRPTPARRNRAEHVAHRRQKFPGAGRGSLRSGFFPRCRGSSSPL